MIFFFDFNLAIYFIVSVENIFILPAAWALCVLFHINKVSMRKIIVWINSFERRNNREYLVKNQQLFFEKTKEYSDIQNLELLCNNRAG